MKFIDEAAIIVRAGKGGDGCVAFHRARFIPRGRPNGGDGGDGGSVYLVAKDNLNTLVDLRSRHFFTASNGGNGMGSDRTGKKGENLFISVPIGTTVYAKQSGELIADMVEAETPLLVARGGSRGLGNTHFKSATNRTPRQSTRGEQGEDRELALELKLLADVGLVGLPNSGKSTLLNAISAAHPKIADYPFTTLTPMLGVVSVDEYRSFVTADLPGLVAGAAKGVGLGARFLRHIQRTRLLLHQVDVGSVADVEESIEAVRTIEVELADSGMDLMRYPRWLVCTKIDLLEADKLAERQQQLQSALNWQQPIFAVSAVSRKGLRTLIESIMSHLENRKDDE